MEIEEEENMDTLNIRDASLDKTNNEVCADDLNNIQIISVLGNFVEFEDLKKECEDDEREKNEFKKIEGNEFMSEHEEEKIKRSNNEQNTKLTETDSNQDISIDRESQNTDPNIVEQCFIESSNSEQNKIFGQNKEFCLEGQDLKHEKFEEDDMANETSLKFNSITLKAPNTNSKKVREHKLKNKRILNRKLLTESEPLVFCHNNFKILQEKNNNTASNNGNNFIKEKDMPGKLNTIANESQSTTKHNYLKNNEKFKETFVVQPKNSSHVGRNEIMQKNKKSLKKKINTSKFNTKTDSLKKVLLKNNAEPIHGFDINKLPIRESYKPEVGIKQKDMNLTLRKNGGNTFKIHSTNMQVKESGSRTAVKKFMVPSGFIVSPSKGKVSRKSDTENSTLQNNSQDIRKSEEYKASLQLIMKNKDTSTETNMFKFSNKPKRINEKRNKKKENSNNETMIQKKAAIKRLPQDLLESLPDQPLQKKKQVPLETETAFKPEKKKKKLKFKSTVLEEGYIPLSAEGATQFALTRLDKEPLLTSAQQAINFRNNQLYGPYNRRISAKDLHNLKQKYKINNTF